MRSHGGGGCGSGETPRQPALTTDRRIVVPALPQWTLTDVHAQPLLPPCGSPHSCRRQARAELPQGLCWGQHAGLRCVVWARWKPVPPGRALLPLTGTPRLCAAGRPLMLRGGLRRLPPCVELRMTRSPPGPRAPPGCQRPAFRQPQQCLHRPSRRHCPMAWTRLASATWMPTAPTRSVLQLRQELPQEWTMPLESLCVGP